MRLKLADAIAKGRERVLEGMRAQTRGEERQREELRAE